MDAVLIIRIICIIHIQGLRNLLQDTALKVRKSCDAVQAFILDPFLLFYFIGAQLGVAAPPRRRTVKVRTAISYR